MTLVVILKLGDGLVLGADSAATLSAGGHVAKAYANVEKIVNLAPGEPLALLVYGVGAMGDRPIPSLAEDLRRTLTGADPARHLRSQYTVEEVAHAVHEFFYQGLYQQHFPRRIHDGHGNSVEIYERMGLVVAGISRGGWRSEVWTIQVDEHGQCPGPQRLLDESVVTSVAAWGEPEVIHRIVCGWSPHLPPELKRAGVPPGLVDQLLNRIPATQLAHPAMPMQDGIDLVDFLIRTACDFNRFALGTRTVAPPVDLAVVTPHQGFRWIRRKHYYHAASMARHRRSV